MIRVFFLLSLVLLPASLMAAAPLDLKGHFVQGGLVFGITEPGSRIHQDGVERPVSEDGIFLIGFGREAGSTSILNVTLPSGEIFKRTLEVGPQNFKIQRIDGLPKRKVTPDPEAVKRIKSDNALVWQVRSAQPRPVADFNSGFDWPLKGTITGVFGSQRILNGKPRSPHKGLDIAAPTGTPIVAPADGIISLRHDDMYLMGKTLMIDHGHGLQSIMIHMSDILVTDGQQVKKGDVIAKVGASGRATGPHLHWGVSLGTIALDPGLLLGEPLQ